MIFEDKLLTAIINQHEEGEEKPEEETPEEKEEEVIE